jgi:hypothetical protein
VASAPYFTRVLSGRAIPWLTILFGFMVLPGYSGAATDNALCKLTENTLKFKP